MAARRFLYLVRSRAGGAVKGEGPRPFVVEACWTAAAAVSRIETLHEGEYGGAPAEVVECWRLDVETMGILRIPDPEIVFPSAFPDEEAGHAGQG